MTSAPTVFNFSHSQTSRRLKQWTVNDYRRMSELGILEANERTELIRGQILVMAAKGTTHVLTLRLLAQALENQMPESGSFISTQDPVQLSDLSEPEPDLAIVKGSLRDYANHHPQAQDILLIVEVADSTIKSDCEIKDKVYAEAGIIEYWVVDIPNRQLHQFYDPTASGYKTHLIQAEPCHATPLEFPHLTLSLTDILPIL